MVSRVGYSVNEPCSFNSEIIRVVEESSKTRLTKEGGFGTETVKCSQRDRKRRSLSVGREQITELCAECARGWLPSGVDG